MTGERSAEARLVSLPCLPPYDFDIALAYLLSSPSSVLEVVDRAAGIYRRAVTLRGRDVLLTVRSAGTVDDPRLTLEIAGTGCDGPLDPETEAEAIAFVRRVLRLDDDPAPFMATALRDPILYRLATHYRGVRPLLVADPYEALLFAVIGQQVNVAFARKMKLALIETFGSRRSFGGQEYRLLPEPARLAAIDPTELTLRQFSRQKARYIVGLSQAIVAGDLDLWALPALPFEEAIAEMTRHKGIGRWTAEYVLMRGLGEPDSIPAADVGLRRIIGYAYRLGRNASEAEVRTLAERWTGWRSWAAFLWWLALQQGDQDPAAGLNGVL